MPVELRSVCQPRAADDVDGGGHVEDIRNGGAITTAAAAGSRQRWRPVRSPTGLACISAAGWWGDTPKTWTTAADTNRGCRWQPPAGGSVSEAGTCRASISFTGSWRRARRGHLQRRGDLNGGCRWQPPARGSVPKNRTGRASISFAGWWGHTEDLDDRGRHQLQPPARAPGVAVICGHRAGITPKPEPATSDRRGKGEAPQQTACHKG